MAPPPTPTSLMDLPASWLLKLATRKTPYEERSTVVSLFRTCAFFRDTVLQHRTAAAEFDLPIAAEDFLAELARLCVLARRSGSVRFKLTEHPVEGNWAHWTGTEPHITHLLVCAMAELGGPLTCVKEVHIWGLQQTALVPAWLKVCCPNVRSLKVEHCTVTPYDLDLPPPPPSVAPTPAPQAHHGGPERPLTCQHLQSVYIASGMPIWQDDDGGGDDSDEDGSDEDDDGAEDVSAVWRQHVRQQLAALPRLTSVVADNEQWMQEPVPVSTTVVALHLTYSTAQLVPHLAVHFPNLRQLDADFLTLDDDALEALLRLPHLERLSVRGFSLQRRHAHRAWAARHLSLGELDVGSFARLPLEGIQACMLRHGVQVTPSRDAQAVARVAEAVRRLHGGGGLAAEGAGGWVEVDGGDSAALLTTLGPLLAALLTAQQRDVWIRDLQDASAATLRALGQQLPSGITTLRLPWCSLQPEAWRALLPSLPASIVSLWVQCTPAPTEDDLMAMCVAAPRPITVAVRGLSADALALVEVLLLGDEQLVTLTCW